MTSVYHTPVLLEESVRLLDIDPAGTYVDLTFGGGGHSRRILSALGDRGRLYAFDQDRDTRDNCPEDSRFHYVESNFRFMRGALRLRGVTRVDGILADLCVSSHHFDAVERGFLLVVFCSMATTGLRPVILSTSGRSIVPTNCRA